MRLYPLFGISILFYFNSFAQITQDTFWGPNIVPNPGFELLRRPLADYDLDGSVGFRNSLASWMSPTKTTPDLLFSINGYGFDQPRNGQSMAAILTHNPQSKRSDTWREYIQICLLEPLKQGEEYILEFWVKRHRLSSLASNNIGAFFGNGPLVNPNYEPLLDLELIVNESNIINPKEREWVLISKQFVAKGYENFLVIGNFFDNDHTQFAKVSVDNPDAYNNSYYLVDDVSLRQILPEPEPVISELKVEVGKVYRLDRIYFAFDKWDLLHESNIQLNELLDLMNKFPEMTIMIKGHTDNYGTEEYNFQLSDRRSNAVYQYLVDHEISIDRLQFKGFGETVPIDTNETNEGRQMNRRVEFEVLTIGAEGIKIENIASDGY